MISVQFEELILNLSLISAVTGSTVCYQNGAGSILIDFPIQFVPNVDGVRERLECLVEKLPTIRYG